MMDKSISRWVVTLLLYCTIVCIACSASQAMPGSGTPEYTAVIIQKIVDGTNIGDTTLRDIAGPITTSQASLVVKIDHGTNVTVNSVTMTATEELASGDPSKPDSQNISGFTLTSTSTTGTGDGTVITEYWGTTVNTSIFYSSTYDFIATVNFVGANYKQSEPVAVSIINSRYNIEVSDLSLSLSEPNVNFDDLADLFNYFFYGEAGLSKSTTATITALVTVHGTLPTGTTPTWAVSFDTDGGGTPAWTTNSFTFDGTNRSYTLTNDVDIPASIPDATYDYTANCNSTPD